MSGGMGALPFSVEREGPQHKSSRTSPRQEVFSALPGTLLDPPQPTMKNPLLLFSPTWNFASLRGFEFDLIPKAEDGDHRAMTVAPIGLGSARGGTRPRLR